MIQKTIQDVYCSIKTIECLSDNYQNNDTQGDEDLDKLDRLL